MKKLICLILTFLFLVTVATGCQNDSDTEKKPSNPRYTCDLSDFPLEELRWMKCWEVYRDSNGFLVRPIYDEDKSEYGKLIWVEYPNFWDPRPLDLEGYGYRHISFRNVAHEFTTCRGCRNVIMQNAY